MNNSNIHQPSAADSPLQKDQSKTDTAIRFGVMFRTQGHGTTRDCQGQFWFFHPTGLARSGVVYSLEQAKLSLASLRKKNLIDDGQAEYLLGQAQVLPARTVDHPFASVLEQGTVTLDQCFSGSQKEAMKCLEAMIALKRDYRTR